MVRETKTLGQGHAPDTKPQDMPTVKNVVVYGATIKLHYNVCTIAFEPKSTRQTENWELAYISEKVEEDALSKRRLVYKMDHLLGVDECRKLKENYAKSSDAELTYRMLLLWKKKQANGLAQLKSLAHILQETGFRKLAEALNP